MKKRSDVMIWTPGMTVDSTASPSESEREELVRSFRCYQNHFFFSLIKNLEDSKSDLELSPDMESFLIVKELVKRTTKVNEQLGGSPAISALVALYAKGDADIYYAGNVPSNALSVIKEKHQQFASQFVDGNPITEHHPETISIEGYRHKIMVTCKEGRSLNDLDQDRLLGRINKLSRAYDSTTVGFGGLNKGDPEDYACLIHRVKHENQARIFIGTNSFRDESKEKIKSRYDLLFPLADIISFNEAELMDVYKAVAGRCASAAEIFEEISPKGRLYSLDDKLVICHSEGGAIAHYNGQDPVSVLAALGFAVSGASLKCATAKYGSRDDINQFSEKNGRNHDLFENTFGCTINSLPLFTVAVPSHDLSKYKDVKITGAGAAFDGYFLGEFLRRGEE